MIAKLIFDVFAGIPLSLGREILVKLRDEVDKERLITEESIKERLQYLQLLLADGELDEKEYEAREGELIERLRAVRQYNRRPAVE